MTILSAALLLFLVIDPLGNIPMFMTTLKKVDEKRQRKVVVRELLVGVLQQDGALPHPRVADQQDLHHLVAG